MSLNRFKGCYHCFLKIVSLYSRLDLDLSFCKFINLFQRFNFVNDRAFFCMDKISSQCADDDFKLLKKILL